MIERKYFLSRLQYYELEMLISFYQSYDKDYDVTFLYTSFMTLELIQPAQPDGYTSKRHIQFTEFKIRNNLYIRNNILNGSKWP